MFSKIKEKFFNLRNQRSIRETDKESLVKHQEGESLVKKSSPLHFTLVKERFLSGPFHSHFFLPKSLGKCRAFTPLSRDFPSLVPTKRSEKTWHLLCSLNTYRSIQSCGIFLFAVDFFCGLFPFVAFCKVFPFYSRS